PYQHLEAFLRRIFNRREDQFLRNRRVNRGWFNPAEPLLAPGGEMLRPAVGRLIRHGAPDAEAFRARVLRPGVQIGQAEHVAELVAKDADVAHALAALAADEI